MLARVTASDAPIAKPFNRQDHLSLRLKQTYVTASFKSVFKVDLDNSGACSPEYRLLKPISIASLTGKFVYKLITSNETLLSSGPIFMDSSFLRAFSVDVSLLAPGTSSKSGVRNLFKL